MLCVDYFYNRRLYYGKMPAKTFWTLFSIFMVVILACASFFMYAVHASGRVGAGWWNFLTEIRWEKLKQQDQLSPRKWRTLLVQIVRTFTASQVSNLVFSINIYLSLSPSPSHLFYSCMGDTIRFSHKERRVLRWCGHHKGWDGETSLWCRSTRKGAPNWWPLYYLCEPRWFWIVREWFAFLICKIF